MDILNKYTLIGIGEFAHGIEESWIFRFKLLKYAKYMTIDIFPPFLCKSDHYYREYEQPNALRDSDCELINFVYKESAKNNQLHIMKWLHENGAQPPNNVYYLAQQKGHTECCEWLESIGFKS
jgi:hypothetical protein